MLKQRIEGIQYGRTINLDASAGDISALIGLMAGEITEFSKKGEGGNALLAAPAELNRKHFIIGSKIPTGGRVSCQIRVPHIKPSANYTTIPTLVIGQFNSHWENDLKAEYCNLQFDK